MNILNSPEFLEATGFLGEMLARLDNGVTNLDRAVGNLAVRVGEPLVTDVYGDTARRVLDQPPLIPQSPEVSAYEEAQQAIQVPQSPEVVRWQEQRSSPTSPVIAPMDTSAEDLNLWAKELAQPSPQTLQGFPRD